MPHNDFLCLRLYDHGQSGDRSEGPIEWHFWMRVRIVDSSDAGRELEGREFDAPERSCTVFPRVVFPPKSTRGPNPPANHKLGMRILSRLRNRKAIKFIFHDSTRRCTCLSPSIFIPVPTLSETMDPCAVHRIPSNCHIRSPRLRFLMFARLFYADRSPYWKLSSTGNPSTLAGSRVQSRVTSIHIHSNGVCLEKRDPTRFAVTK
jgi:hypothetical protein